MKKLFILASAVFAFNAMANELNCESLTSKVVLDKKTVTIEAKSIPLNDELRAMVLNSTGISDANGAIKVGVSITFPKKDLDCSKAISKVFSCTGKTKKASVTLNISQQSGFGSANTQTQRKPVKIENIDIRTGLELNQLKVNSSMFVKMNGEFHLELEQNFESSICK